MATIMTVGTGVKGRADADLQTIKDALDAYESLHPGAQATLYRQNSASIRVRVIDRRFDGMTKSRRHDDVWQFLAGRVPGDALAEVSLVLAVPPAELANSFANFEFENPSPQSTLTDR